MAAQVQVFVPCMILNKIGALSLDGLAQSWILVVDQLLVSLHRVEVEIGFRVQVKFGVGFGFS